jgi:hypothetical protein
VIKIINIVFIALILALFLYHVILEIMQIMSSKKSYLMDGWNFINISSLILNIAYILSDICELDVVKLRPIGSACVLLMWIQLFYFFRLFYLTA